MIIFFFTHALGNEGMEVYLPKLLRTSSGVTNEEVLCDIVENEDLILEI